MASILDNSINKLEHLKIPFSDIQVATDNFSKTYEIEPSKYFTVYRAELDHFDIDDHSSVQGQNKDRHAKRRNTVAIKRIKHKLNEVYFYNNIRMLSSVKHHNIVSLLGFCVNGSEMILVTENVSNDHLDDYLGNFNLMHILTWENRLKICINVAHSLNYLHSTMEDQKMVIDSCIDRYNIWLDENLGVKIVESGMSVFLHQNENDEEFVQEYEKLNKLQRELDVYSFGKVLFEILCGKKNDDPIFLKNGDKGLVHVARQIFYWETLEKMIDPLIMENTSENNLDLNRGANKDSLNTFIKIAYDCIVETIDQRPTMAVVVKQLEEALLFQKLRDKFIPKMKNGFSAPFGYIWFLRGGHCEELDGFGKSEVPRRSSGSGGGAFFQG
ncbi:hypothetical protein QVD17_31369 [Tagetes erecta]|uniref:Protein kinase domain-containing protein n=1 Tax=Tagetes erecta TaxID=13708 RepID=A0AAD8K6W4_TARER|nr:hypothetical protein QVD17_31369 [Tagetes erecta]